LKEKEDLEKEPLGGVKPQRPEGFFSHFFVFPLLISSRKPIYFLCTDNYSSEDLLVVSWGISIVHLVVLWEA
jgi:hypothetical protein